MCRVVHRLPHHFETTAGRRGRSEFVPNKRNSPVGHHDMPIKCRRAEKEQEAAAPAGEEELKPNFSALIKLGEDSRSDSSSPN